MGANASRRRPRAVFPALLVGVLVALPVTPAEAQEKVPPGIRTRAERIAWSEAGHAATNSDACYDERCHPAGSVVPFNSVHVRVECTSCHGQLRPHVRARTAALAEGVEVAAEKDEVAPAIRCAYCHLHRTSKPRTFAQIDVHEHYPAVESKRTCAGCHRPHNPRPKMRHPMPAIAVLRKGREGCLNCHLESTVAVAPPTGERTSFDNWVSKRAEVAKGGGRGTAEGEFAWLLDPPRVPHDHGHGSNECISCHAQPPPFIELAKSVHGMKTRGCRRCHGETLFLEAEVDRWKH